MKMKIMIGMMIILIASFNIVAANEVICADSDSGKDYYNKGYIYVHDTSTFTEAGLPADTFLTVLSPNQAILTLSGVRKTVVLGNAYEYYIEGVNATVLILEISYISEDNPDNAITIKIRYQSEDKCGVSYDGVASDNPDILNEKSCSGDDPIEELYECPNGCEDGACIPDKSETCTDSDGGKNLYEVGTAEHIDGHGNYDYCSFLENPNGDLYEGICDEDGNPKHVQLACPEETPYCNRGVCSSVPPKCTDTDDGIDVAVKGTITEPRMENGPQHTDYCENIKTFEPYEECDGDSCGLREFYCQVPYMTTAYKNVACPNGCKDGVCIEDTTNECTDSDGGKDYYEKGYGTGDYQGSVYEKRQIWGEDPNKCSARWESGLAYDIVYDCCSDSEINNQLNEAYCDSNGNLMSVAYQCPNGCKDGACIREDNLVKETVTCYFVNSGNEQKCYSDDGRFSCSGVEKCSVVIAGQKGDKLTWKSSCGGYDYSIIDGIDNNVDFSCKDTERSCEAIFSSCSCAYNCMEITPGEPRVDCARACTVDEISDYKPDCGYRNGVCTDINKDNECSIPECETPVKTGRYDSNGCPVYECEKRQTGIYVKLNEKFELVEGQSAKVTDYNYMKISLTELGGICTASYPSTCTNFAYLSVSMPTIYTTEKTVSETSETTTQSGMDIKITQGQSKDVFGAKLTYIKADGKQGIFLVQKSEEKGGVDIKISPTEQTIAYGEKTSYVVYITDKHDRIVCAAVCTDDGYCPPCTQPSYTYNLAVRNLPFSKEFSSQITLNAGESKKLELLVKPYELWKAQDGEDHSEAPSVSGSVVKETEASKTEIVKVAKATESNKGSYMDIISNGEAAGVAYSNKGNTGEAITEDKEEKILISSPTTDLARKYKFSISASLQNDYSIQDTAYATLIIKPKIPPKPPEFPGEKVSFKLYKGWNLISLPGKLLRFDSSNLGSNQKLIGYVFIKEEQKYYSLNKAEEKLGAAKLKEYLIENAFWVYSKSSATLNAWVDRKVSYQDLKIVEGWNLVPITEDMVGGYLTDVLGDCNLEKVYLWKPEEQKWNTIGLDNKFSSSHVGYGFLVKAKEYCKLTGVEIISPPPMPQ